MEDTMECKLAVEKLGCVGVLKIVPFPSHFMCPI